MKTWVVHYETASDICREFVIDAYTSQDAADAWFYEIGQDDPTATILLIAEDVH